MKKNHHASKIVLKRPLGAAVRRGLPKESRKGLYVHFIELSWPRFLFTALVIFLLVNTLFGGLYLLDPGGIGGARPNTFFDTFMFSVETLATIGYGHLSPIGTLTNILVVTEAALGLMGVAIFTGLLFAKTARPRAQFLFSQPLLITLFDEKPHLAFRVANTRGGDILDAHVSVSALIDVVTKEKAEFTKMFELKLVRNHSPFFSLSWTVLHELDESSPLYGLVDGTLECQKLRAISAVIRGHDGTYAQTVYARHTYDLNDLRENHRFVDIISNDPQGNMILDFTKFNQTEEIANL